MASTPATAFELRWGLLSTGWISSMFARDLLATPHEAAGEVSHRIVAVASRSQGAADSFKAQWLAGVDADVAAHPTYEALFADERVDAVYVATPHGRHYDDARAALLAGKHVLLEKAPTVTAPQLKALADLARERKRFLMEAVWTRFQPCAREVTRIVESGEIGVVTSVESGYRMVNPMRTMDAGHRLLNAEVAGGSIMDLGPYALVFALLAVVHPQRERYAGGQAIPVPRLASTMVFSTDAEAARLVGGRAVDEACTAVATFDRPSADPREPAVALATLRTAFGELPPLDRAVLIQGTKGSISIDYPTSNPLGLTVERYDVVANPRAEFVPLIRDPATHTVERKTFAPAPGGARGYIYEADEVARCVRDGKLESERMPLNESILAMEILDEIRRQNGLVFPGDLEKVPTV